jgi:hypothetical protein
MGVVIEIRIIYLIKHPGGRGSNVELESSSLMYLCAPVLLQFASSSPDLFYMST